ncbi:MAG: DUF3422 domain-containing protein [Pseudomonadota bacterium]
MSMVFDEHPERLSVTNELHARPFQPMRAPGRALQLAFKQPSAAERDPERDREHLTALLDRFGVAHPAPGANHHTVDIGRFVLKWERHTEFVSYTLYEQGETDRMFQAGLADHLPQDWVASAPGKVIAAIQCEFIMSDGREDALEMMRGPLAPEFSAESLAVAWVVNKCVLALGDFRIHEGGYSRFALIICGNVGPRRIGRVCQRLMEIEVYRTLSMLALPVARKTAGRLTEIERDLTAMVSDVASQNGGGSDEEILASLTQLSADIEALKANTAFRFGAGGAYEALVNERIDMLHEERVEGRQQLREFMLRRYQPAMRTVHAAERRLQDISLRASRMAQLLRTRVNVALEAQNQDLLESMNARADMQLRLQRTVEGLSVVAISYYAVSLAGYLLYPLSDVIGLSEGEITAVATIPIVLGVWWFVRRIRAKLEKDG